MFNIGDSITVQLDNGQMVDGVIVGWSSGCSGKEYLIAPLCCNNIPCSFLITWNDCWDYHDTNTKQAVNKLVVSYDDHGNVWWGEDKLSNSNNHVDEDRGGLRYL